MIYLLKQNFRAEAVKLMEKYLADLKEWEAKMLAQGKLNLVRSSFRKTITSTIKNAGKKKQKMTSKLLKKNKADRAKKMRLLKSLTQTAKRIRKASKKLEAEVNRTLKKVPAEHKKSEKPAQTQATQAEETKKE